MGKVEDRHSGGGRVPFFNGEDACQPYAVGHPIGASSRVDAVR